MPIVAWNPLTLQGAGLYHLAMGAILGVAAWSRGQEKITAMRQNPSIGFRDDEEGNDDDEPMPVTPPKMPSIKKPTFK